MKSFYKMMSIIEMQSTLQGQAPQTATSTVASSQGATNTPQNTMQQKRVAEMDKRQKTKVVEDFKKRVKELFSKLGTNLGFPINL